MAGFNPRRPVCALVVVALFGVYGCSGSPEFVSAISVEDKIARLRIGASDKSEVESIFGPDQGNDRNRWTYQFADKQFEIFERRRGLGVGALPVSAGVVPTNTRVIVTVGFTDTGIVKMIEVARFFEEPFINDYWFMVKHSAKNPLEALATIGESVGFKVAGLDKNAGTFNLEDPLGQARLAVKLDGQVLKVTSRNPHHRMANEYRIYVKRESALTTGIASSDLVQ